MAGDDKPSCCFPTIVGSTKIPNGILFDLECEYVGHEALEKSIGLNLRYPIKNGIVNDWEDMEKIWRHAYKKLNIAPKEHPVF